MGDCIFCKIAAGEMGTTVAAGDDWVAFDDAGPQAPQHLLVIPRRHISTVNDLTDGDDALLGRMVRAARDLAAERGIAESGYRLVINTNAEGGQSVFHVHLHLLGGRQLAWPPG